MEKQTAQEWQVDTHRVQFEPPNLFIFRWKGPVNVSHVDRVFACFDAVNVTKPVVIADIRRSDVPEPHARAKMSRMEIRTEAIAVLVSGAHKRVVMEMLVRARNLLTKQPVNVAFFETEEACRTWLATNSR